MVRIKDNVLANFANFCTSLNFCGGNVYHVYILLFVCIVSLRLKISVLKVRFNRKVKIDGFRLFYFNMNI